MLAVRVTPGRDRDAVLGWEARADLTVPRLRVRLRAVAEQGRANEALLRLLARTLAIPSRRLRIARGQRSRDTLIRVEGLNEKETRVRIAAAAR